MTFSYTFICESNSDQVLDVNAAKAAELDLREEWRGLPEGIGQAIEAICAHGGADQWPLMRVSVTAHAPAPGFSQDILTNITISPAPEGAVSEWGRYYE